MNSTLILIIGATVLITIVAVVIILMMNRGKYEVIDDENPLKEEKKIKEKKPKKSLINIEKKSTKSTEKKAVSSNGLINYDVYIMNTQEKVMWSLLGMVVLFAVGMMFYGSVIWALALSLLGLLYPKIKNKSIIEKRKEKLLLQFKEALYSISSSLSAGKAVPAAFKEAYEEMKMIFDEGKDSYIVNELLIINRRLEMNETIEGALADLAERSTLEDIETFAEIFISCNKTGGNLKRVILESSKMIGDKIGIKQEINTMISGKKMEGRVLTVIPLVVVLMLKFLAPDLINNLYSGVGHIMATVAIVLILLAALWSEKIMRIEV